MTFMQKHCLVLCLQDGGGLSRATLNLRRQSSVFGLKLAELITERNIAKRHNKYVSVTIVNLFYATLSGNLSYIPERMCTLFEKTFRERPAFVRTLV